MLEHRRNGAKRIAGGVILLVLTVAVPQFVDCRAIVQDCPLTAQEAAQRGCHFHGEGPEVENGKVSEPSGVTGDQGEPKPETRWPALLTRIQVQSHRFLLPEEEARLMVVPAYYNDVWEMR